MFAEGPKVWRRQLVEGQGFEGQGFEGQGFEGQGFEGQGFGGGVRLLPYLNLRLSPPHPSPLPLMGEGD